MGATPARTPQGDEGRPRADGSRRRYEDHRLVAGLRSQGFTLSSSAGRMPVRGEFLHPLKRLRERLLEALFVLVGGVAIDDERRALSVVLQRVLLKRS